MKGTKMQKGITLIALIITIVVLLILAVVAIREVQGDGIIVHAKNAIREHQIGKEKETITLSLNGWKLDKQVNRETTFKSFMEESLQNNASVEGPDAGPLTVTFEDTKNQYIVTDDGTITFVEKSIIVKDENGNIISQNTITVEVGKTKVLTVEKTGGLEGEIIYKSSDDTIATIDENGKVTAIAEGTTKIKIECGKHKIECEVIVTNTPVDPPIDEIPEDLETYILGGIGEDGNRPGRQFIYNSSTEEGIFDVNGGMIFVKQYDTLLANGGVIFVNIGENQPITITITYAGDTYLFNVDIAENDNGITYNLRKLIVKELNAEGKIEAIEDLVDFAMTVNNGNNLAGKTITLEKSLDFQKDEDYRNPMDTTYGDINGNGNAEEGIKAELTTGTGFIPIGSVNMENELFLPFSGSFNGKGYSISNLYINDQEMRIASAGLFGVVSNNGNTITNLKLESANINSMMYTGGIIGMVINGENEISISDCNVELSNIISMNMVSAIVGMVYGDNASYGTINITNCNLKDSMVDSGGAASGVLGMAMLESVNISECEIINSDIIAHRLASGILGYSEIKNINIFKCSVFDTDVIATDEESDMEIGVHASGIAGETRAAVLKINECNVFRGSISSAENAAGICYGLGTEAEIKNCTNNTTTFSGKELLGGILVAPYGYYHEVSVNIMNCHNKATVKEALGDFAGIYNGYDARIKNLNIFKCTNSATVEMDGEVNGIMCSMEPYDGINIIDCHNYGNLTGRNVTGIAYCSTDINVYNSHNEGDLTATKLGAVGILEVSNYSGGNVYNCYNIGKITTTDNKPIGIIRGNGDIENCYSTGYSISHEGNTVNTKNTKVFTGEEKDTEEGRTEIDNYIIELNKAVETNNKIEGAIQWKKWTLGANGYPVFE